MHCHRPKMVCHICGKSKNGSAMTPATLIRDDVAEMIKASYPRWKPEGYVCFRDLKQFRIKCIRKLFESKRRTAEEETRIIKN